VRVLPNGNMRVDVRLTAKLDDGEFLYVTYGGVLKRPSAESWTRFLRGERIAALEWYCVVAPTFETQSKKYAWLKDIQGVRGFVSIQSGDVIRAEGRGQTEHRSNTQSRRDHRGRSYRPVRAEAGSKRKVVAKLASLASLDVYEGEVGGLRRMSDDDSVLAR
jgi:hypothetical protein